LFQFSILPSPATGQRASGAHAKRPRNHKLAIGLNLGKTPKDILRWNNRLRLNSVENILRHRCGMTTTGCDRVAMRVLGQSFVIAERVMPAAVSARCQTSAKDGVYRIHVQSEFEDRRMFQIIRLALDDNGEVAARRPLQPLFELWEDAMAMAEFDASRLWGDYGWDEERNCWWATDSRGARYRLVVEAVASADAAA
jgi:hypothetical protein